MRKKARSHCTGQGVFFAAVLAKQPDNLPVIGKTPGFMLGIHLFAVRADSEHTAGTGDQFNLSAKFLFQFSLQTGGSGFVVSRSAVFNGDLHRFLLICWRDRFLCLPKNDKG